MGRLQMVVDARTSQSSLDVNLLFMALHVINYSKGQIESNLYDSVKTKLEECHAKGAITLNLLAAEITIAAFEVAQGIYPAAYLTTSKCTRLSYYLGLHDSSRAVQVLPNPSELTLAMRLHHKNDSIQIHGWRGKKGGDCGGLRSSSTGNIVHLTKYLESH